MERGAAAQARLRENLAAVTTHDAPGRRQSDADAGEFVLPVHALERLVETSAVRHIETDAVVGHADRRLTVDLGRRDADLRRLHRTGEFPGVVEQVTQQDFNHRRVTVDPQSRIDTAGDPTLGFSG